MHTAGWLLRLLKVVTITIFGISLLACSDDSAPPPPPPQQHVDDDDDDDDQDTNEKPTAVIDTSSPLDPKHPVTVTFSEAMDDSTLTLDGTIGANAESQWISSDTLELTPRLYWPAGVQMLVIDATDSEGLAMDTLKAEVEVRSGYATFQEAITVIGQPDFESGDPRQDPEAPSAAPNTLDRPASGVDYIADKDLLFIGDTNTARVLGFRGIPEMNNANADFVVGQPDFWSSIGETSREKVRRAQGISAQAGKLMIADPDSHRVTIYDGPPQAWPAPASVVLGQENYEDFNNACAPHRMNHVHNQFVTPSGRLLVADANNNRILVWNEIPQQIGELPDLVIGQQRLDQCAPNDDDQNNFENPTPSARTLRHPTGIWSDDERLVIVDNYNNRVLLWHEFPNENYVPADVVLGQGNMESLVPNDDDVDGLADAQPTARVVDYPWSTWFENGQLFVADTNNNRVLIWNGWPTESFAPADIVIGQPDFTSNLPNAGAEQPAANTLNHPMGVRVVGEKLLVTDTENSRVLVYEIE